MRIRDFRFFNPGGQALSLIYYSTGSSYTIKQANINVNDCANRDLFDILLNVETLGFEIDGSTYTTNILSREQRPNYFHYEIEDILVPSASINNVAVSYTHLTLPTILRV